MNRRFIPILTILLLIATIVHSQTRPRESLRGLSGVYVYVHPVGKEVEAGGLSTNQIQKEVEAQLHEARVNIYSEPQPADGSANLVIIIDTVKHPQGTYLYEVDVSLLQEVHLARRQEPDPFPAQTWDAKAIGVTSANRMDLMLEPLRAKMGDFIKDYLAANVKPSP